MTGNLHWNHDFRRDIMMLPLVGLILMLAVACAQGRGPTTAPRGPVWPVGPDVAKTADARTSASGLM